MRRGRVVILFTSTEICSYELCGGLALLKRRARTPLTGNQPPFGQGVELMSFTSTIGWPPGASGCWS